MAKTQQPRIYVRPVGLVDSPQAALGNAVRVGSSMVWCHALCVERHGEGPAEKVLTHPEGLDQALSDWPDEAIDTVRRQIENLARPRAPLQLGERTIRLDQPRVMAILNMTPDSFSDGGRYADDPQRAAASGFAMLEGGAALIDVGGESTRPDAPAVWEGDEIKRVVPVIERLARGGAAVSIDTRKASVMEAALDAGAGLVNDVSALLHDDRALEVVAKAGCPVVLMHAPSQGADPHAGAGYGNVVTEVYDWLEVRIAEVIAAGIDRDRILIDPGIGFGKSLSDNLALTNNLALFQTLGQPLLFGASRKRMIGALSNEAKVDARLGGSVSLAVQAVERGAQMVRVHDVAETVQALHVWRGLKDAALTAF